jgi:hypothetical protein
MLKADKVERILELIVRNIDHAIKLRAYFCRKEGD